MSPPNPLPAPENFWLATHREPDKQAGFPDEYLYLAEADIRPLDCNSRFDRCCLKSRIRTEQGLGCALSSFQRKDMQSRPHPTRFTGETISLTVDFDVQ